MSKPIDSLSPLDLKEHPIWEYLMNEEEGDETWVHPTQATAVPSNSDYVTYHVACEVKTANGKVFSGFMSFCNGKFEEDAPVVVGEGENYWVLSSPPPRKYRERFELFFGCAYQALFPATWTLKAQISGEKTPRVGSFSPA